MDSPDHRGSGVMGSTRLLVTRGRAPRRDDQQRLVDRKPEITVVPEPLELRAQRTMRPAETHIPGSRTGSDSRKTLIPCSSEGIVAQVKGSYASHRPHNSEAKIRGIEASRLFCVTCLVLRRPVTGTMRLQWPHSSGAEGALDSGKSIILGDLQKLTPARGTEFCAWRAELECYLITTSESSQ